MQVGNVIGDIERTFHVVRDDNAGHPKALLQPVNQAIDTVRDYRIKTRCRLIVQYARGPANDGACETNSLLHSTAQTLGHLIFLPLHLDDFEHFLHFRVQHLWIPFTRLTQWKSDVFLHCHGIKKRAALEKNAYLLAYRSMLALIHADNLSTINPNFPRTRPRRCHEMFKQNTFDAAD